MLSLLLNLVYAALLLAVSPWLVYQATTAGKYREGWRQKFWGLVPRRRGDRPCVWLHAVSVGEVTLLEPLIARLKQQCPQWELVVSATTRTGYELARRKYAAHSVFYCPLDFSWAIRTALHRLRPQLLILAELELWPNLIRLSKAQGIQIAIVNGRLSEHSFRGYRRIRPLVQRMLQCLDLLAVQNQTYADRFRALGAPPERVHVTGSLKFDGAESDRQNPRTRQLATLSGITPQDVVFLAGSTQQPEELLALEAFMQLAPEHPQLRLIITPRHPQRFDEVAAMLDRSTVRWQRRSRLETTGPDPTARVLLVDAVGELGAWWGTAQIAYVGGSMGKRQGQNMIEPAAYGAAVSFGPQTKNFRDVVSLLLEQQAAIVVQDGRELTQFVHRCLEEPAYGQQLGSRARQLVASQLGATERTTQLLFDLRLPGATRQAA